MVASRLKKIFLVNFNDKKYRHNKWEVSYLFLKDSICISRISFETSSSTKKLVFFFYINFVVKERVLSFWGINSNLYSSTFHMWEKIPREDRLERLLVRRCPGGGLGWSSWSLHCWQTREILQFRYCSGTVWLEHRLHSSRPHPLNQYLSFRFSQQLSHMKGLPCSLKMNIKAHTWICRVNFLGLLPSWSQHG